MTTFAPSRFSPALPRWLQTSRPGWIGVDIGTAGTKLAQLEKVGGRIRFQARWSIDHHHAGLLKPEDLAASRLPCSLDAAHVRAAFGGRVAAATLPTAFMQIRHMDLPPGSDDELRGMIDEELHAEAAGGAAISFDYLEALTAASFEGETQPFIVFAAPQELTLGAARALETAGLECEAIDATAAALARAIALSEPADADKPAAALDIGHSSVLLVVARGGDLLFTRQLRGLGLNALLKPLQEGLHVSPAEAEQLLGRLTGLNPTLAGALAGLAKAAHELTIGPLHQLAAEVKRTLDFIDMQFRSIAPKRLVLLGGGALVEGLPAALAEVVPLPVKLWSLANSGEAPRRDDALFGVAAALSSLAWETSR